MEENDNVIFTRKMNEGASKNSYGIHVAKLAGLPSPVILRATQLLNNFLSTKTEKTVKTYGHFCCFKSAHIIQLS